MLKNILEEMQIETFDLGLEKFKYKKLSKEEAYKLLLKIYPELKNDLEKYQFKRAYLYKQEGYEFLIILLFLKGYLEVHFINLTIPEEIDLGILKKPILLFSFIFNILFDYLSKKCYNIVILIPEKSKERRYSFYMKIIEKLIKKYNLEYDVETKDYDIYLKCKRNKLESFRKRR